MKDNAVIISSCVSVFIARYDRRGFWAFSLQWLLCCVGLGVSVMNKAKTRVLLKMFCYKEHFQQVNRKEWPVALLLDRTSRRKSRTESIRIITIIAAGEDVIFCSGQKGNANVATVYTADTRAN
eukprot:g67812.t1